MLDDAVGLEVRRATGKVPAKDVDDEGGDDEGVHAHERHDGEEDAARLVGPCEERDGKLDERGALR